MAELKPCPFCGGEAILETVDGNSSEGGEAILETVDGNSSEECYT